MRLKYAYILLILLIISSSCNAIKPTVEEAKAFKSLNRINYPFAEIKNGDSPNTISDLLEAEEISTLENWKNSEGNPERLIKSECVGCSDEISGYFPVYKVKKGKFIHFGLKNSQGIQNLVFRKNGTFMNLFFMFEGYSQDQFNDKLQKQDLKEYEVIEGVYPIEIGKEKLIQELVEYNSFAGIGDWYESPFPTKIVFERLLREKRTDLPFKFVSGLYSIQGEDNKGEFKIINFFEPVFCANAVAFNENQSFESVTEGYYGNATFFLISLEEASEIEINIEPNDPNHKFQFSVFENDTFHTLEEYLNMDMAQFDSFLEPLEKGQYLIRVIHENSDFIEDPLYNLKISKVFTE
ncbi:hypothetical protein [Algoriphagus zhangzhouensis]|uniref:Uncharacterized protein n=1 Tax=Algoriphagus zhangzhouensis TaxID=1073327 RepID=A0A1M7ZHH1_9BACT|nr:hypothetical protein [Algoriphagus zhangzhouensis]TDY44168.1 hypothetical protein A8938_3379 [Algoriphagus zhangzhouensis]SHO64323.1 hypothetical protein SAMN04488108_3374 [Algoriphagus zhangzhouensis]